MLHCSPRLPVIADCCLPFGSMFCSFIICYYYRWPTNNTHSLLRIIASPILCLDSSIASSGIRVLRLSFFLLNSSLFFAKNSHEISASQDHDPEPLMNAIASETGTHPSAPFHLSRVIMILLLISHTGCFVAVTHCSIHPASLHDQSITKLV